MDQIIKADFLQHVAGILEGLLLESQEGIDNAYRTIEGGVKVSIGIMLEPSSKGVCVNYSLSYPLQPAPEPALKETVKKKETIDPGQLSLFEAVKDGSVKFDVKPI
jgi:hypothetical protein